MSWTCPFCDREHADSIIGLPSTAHPSEKTHCLVCAVDPSELQGLIEQWREYGGPADEACADEAEELIDV